MPLKKVGHTIALMVKIGEYTVTSFSEKGDVRDEGEMRRRILLVIEIEAPITEQLLKKRVINSYGLMRIGERLDALISSLLAKMKNENSVIFRDDTFHKEGEEEVFRPTPDDPEKVRYSYQIPPSEGAYALLYSLNGESTLTQKALLEKFKCVMGYKKKGSQVEKLFKNSLEYAIRNGKIIKLKNGRVKLSKEPDLLEEQC